MITSPLCSLPKTPPAPAQVAAPRGLTPRDTDRITAAIAAARTESTRRIYACTWGQ